MHAFEQGNVVPINCHCPATHCMPLILNRAKCKPAQLQQQRLLCLELCKRSCAKNALTREQFKSSVSHCTSFCDRVADDYTSPCAQAAQIWAPFKC